MNFLPRSVYLSINLFITVSIYRVFPSGLDGKESAAMWSPKFDPWVWKIPWWRTWLPTPAFLPGEFHGQRRLGGL